MFVNFYSKLSTLSKFLIVSLSIAGLIAVSVQLDLIKFPPLQATGVGLEMVIISPENQVNSSGISAVPVIALHALSGSARNVNLTLTSVNLPTGTSIVLGSQNDHLNYLDVPDEMTLSNMSNEIKKINISIGTNSGANEWNFLSPSFYLPSSTANGTYRVNISASDGTDVVTDQLQIVKTGTSGENIILPNVCNGNKKEVSAGSSVGFNMAIYSDTSTSISFSSELPNVAGLTASFSPNPLSITSAMSCSSNNYTFTVNTTSSTPNGYYAPIAKNSVPNKADFYIPLRVKVNNSSVPGGSEEEEEEQEEQTTNNNQQTTTNNQQSTPTTDTSSADRSTSDTSSTTTSTTTTTSAQKAATALATRGTEATKVSEDSQTVLNPRDYSGYPAAKVIIKGEKFVKKDLVILWRPTCTNVTDSNGENQTRCRSSYNFKNSDGSPLVITSDKIDKDGKFNQEITLPNNSISAYQDTHVIKIGNVNYDESKKVYSTELYAEGTVAITAPTAEEKAANPELKTPLTKSEVATQMLYQKSVEELSSDKELTGSREKTALEYFTKSIDDVNYRDVLPTFTSTVSRQVTSISGGINIKETNCTYSKSLSQTKTFAQAVNLLVIPSALADNNCTTITTKEFNADIYGVYTEISGYYNTVKNLNTNTANNMAAALTYGNETGNWEPLYKYVSYYYSEVHSGSKLLFDLKTFTEFMKNDSGTGLGTNGEVLNQNIPSTQYTQEQINLWFSNNQQINQESTEQNQTNNNQTTQTTSSSTISVGTDVTVTLTINSSITTSSGNVIQPGTYLYSSNYPSNLPQGTTYAGAQISSDILGVLPPGNANWNITIKSGDNPITTINDGNRGEFDSAKINKLINPNLSSNTDDTTSDDQKITKQEQKDTRRLSNRETVEIAIKAAGIYPCLSAKVRTGEYRYVPDADGVAGHYEEIIRYGNCFEGMSSEQIVKFKEEIHNKLVGEQKRLEYEFLTFGIPSGSGAAFDNSKNRSLVKLNFAGEALAASELENNTGSTNYIQINTKDSKVALLVTDPLGHNLGYNPLIQTNINQINGAQYTNSLSENSSIFIPDVGAGNYDIRLIGLEDSRYDVTVTLAALDKTYTQRFAGDIKQNEVVYGGITTDFETESTLTTKEKITNFLKDFFSNRYNIIYTVLLTLCLIGGVWVVVRVIKRRRLAR